ncbi:MAG: HEAT repeat domain-containing protein [Alphaproteobacteria bacterium]|nr:HEAT repeat domain-containing protein [Alphaproteobacteria bacterium]
MIGVQILWPLAWFLATLAVFWMVLLIGGRLLRNRSARRHAEASNAVLGIYMRLMQDDATALERLEAYRNEPRLLAECLLQVLDLVRGADRTRMLDQLTRFGVDELLRSSLGKGSAQARLAVIEALGAFEGEKAEAALRRIIHDEADGTLRLAAAGALLGMGAEVDVNQLIADSQARHEPWSAALAQVLKLDAQRATQRCEELLGRAELPDTVRVFAAEALSGVGDYRVIPALAAAAHAQSRFVRAAAISALGRLMHPAALPVVREALTDEDWRVRSAAAIAAREAGFVELVDQLSPLLHDPVWSVRFQAAEALAAFGPAGVGRLREIARGSGDAAARAASLTLAERGFS